MPKMNGDEFVSRIRNEQGINKSTPVIMVTGFKPDSEDDSTLWEGVFFLEKPITWKKLEFFINCIFKNIKKDSQ
jgi:CheY-like chemotaxis protein